MIWQLSPEEASGEGAASVVGLKGSWRNIMAWHMSESLKTAKDRLLVQLQPSCSSTQLWSRARELD